VLAVPREEIHVHFTYESDMNRSLFLAALAFVGTFGGG